MLQVIIICNQFFFIFNLFNYYILYLGAAIEASLKQLAERRTDIFGVGVEETAIGKKIGEEETRKDDKVNSNKANDVNSKCNPIFLGYLGWSHF